MKSSASWAGIVGTALLVPWLMLLLPRPVGGQGGTLILNPPTHAANVQLRDASGAAVSVGGGTQYDEGSAGTGTDKVTLAGCIRRDAAGVAVGVADGDRTPCTTDATGAVRVHVNTVTALITNPAASAANVILRDSAGNEVSVGGGTQYSQGAAATDTDVLTMAGCVRADSAAVATGVADGDRARCIVDASGRLWVNVGTGTVTANAGTNLNTSALLTTTAHDAAFGTAGTADAQVRSVQGVASMTPLLVDGSATTQPVSGTVTADAGTNLNTSALLTTTAHDAAFGTAGSADAQVRSIQGIAGGTAVPVSGTVTVTDGSGALNVIVDSGTVTTVSTVTSVTAIGTSVTPGTSAGHLGKAEDAGVNSGDTGVSVLHQRQDTPATTSADGDYTTAKVNQYGHQFTAALCNDPALTTTVAITGTINGNSELVALTSNQTIYLCGYNFIAGGTANVRLVYGTGTACATGETGITGLYPLIAQTGINAGFGGAVIAKAAISNAVCIETSASITVGGMVQYVKGAF